MKKDNLKLIIPDGGWGWMVCIGAILITLSLRAVDPCFGLLFGDLLKDLKIESTGASMIMSILETVMNFSGMVVGPLIKKFSCRKVAAFGSLLSCTGLILTSQANSLTYIICTYSILGGFGTGLATTSSFVTLNTYFKKRRSQVVGLSTSGTALGMMCMPQIVSILLMQYEFRGATLIIGALALHAVVGSCLYQPVARHMIRAPNEENVELVSNDTKNEGDTIQKLAEIHEDEILRKVSMTSNALEMSTLDLTQKHWTNEESSPKIPTHNENVDEPKANNSFLEKLVNLFDLRLLMDPVYVNIIIGMALIYEAEVNFRFIMPFYLSSIGMSKKEVAFAISLLAFADIVARITMPIIFAKLKYRNRRVLWISAQLVSIVRLIIAGLMPGKLLMVALLINGFLRGCTMINFNLTISEHCSLEMLPSALGLVNVSKGLGVITLGPLVGFIRDRTGSYPAAICTMSIFMAICSVLWGVELFAKNIRMKRNKLRNNSRQNEIVL